MWAKICVDDADPEGRDAGKCSVIVWTASTNERQWVDAGSGRPPPPTESHRWLQFLTSDAVKLIRNEENPAYDLLLQVPTEETRMTCVPPPKSRLVAIELLPLLKPPGEDRTLISPVTLSVPVPMIPTPAEPVAGLKGVLSRSLVKVTELSVVLFPPRSTRPFERPKRVVVGRTPVFMMASVPPTKGGLSPPRPAA